MARKPSAERGWLLLQGQTLGSHTDHLCNWIRREELRDVGAPPRRPADEGGAAQGPRKAAQAPGIAGPPAAAQGPLLGAPGAVGTRCPANHLEPPGGSAIEPRRELPVSACRALSRLVAEWGAPGAARRGGAFRGPRCADIKNRGVLRCPRCADNVISRCFQRSARCGTLPDTFAGMGQDFGIVDRIAVGQAILVEFAGIGLSRVFSMRRTARTIEGGGDTSGLAPRTRQQKNTIRGLVAFEGSKTSSSAPRFFSVFSVRRAPRRTGFLRAVRKNAPAPSALRWCNPGERSPLERPR